VKSIGLIIITLLMLLGLLVPAIVAFAVPKMEMGRIAFSSNRDGNYQIYVMNADGTNVTRLTYDSGQDRQPVWSPDGKEIAFQSDCNGNTEIYVINANGTQLRKLTNEVGLDGNPSWSPDGTRIIFDTTRDGNLEIYVMNADGTNQQNLTNNPGDDYSPAWSPDGTKIAFVSYRGDQVTEQIYTMNADGTNQRNLTNDYAHHFNPAWSPDGGKIAFDWYVHRLSDIGVVNANDSGWSSVTHGSYFIAASSHPDWSKDGNLIVFADSQFSNEQYRTLASDIYAMNADGTNQQNLTNNPADDLDPAWFWGK
jgi:Tol biopolymer transport system component